MIEVVMCVVIGLLLIASGAFLFIGQVKGYKDIGSQARLQTMTKNAVQGMNTEIANTGACLADKRYKFVMQSQKLRITYVDLKARHCGSDDTVTLSYYVKAGTTASGDTLMSELTCNSGQPVFKPLIKGLGAVSVAFTYYDINGAATATASKVKAVEFSLDVKSKKGASLFVRERNPKVRVELLN